MTTNKIARKLLAAVSMAFALMIVPSVAVKAESPSSIYIVEKNDNLSKISKKLTGKEDYWRDIYNANSAVVKNNYIIYTGQHLIIPGTVNDVIAAQTSAAPVAPVVTVPAVPVPVAPVVTTPQAAPVAPATSET